MMTVHRFMVPFVVLVTLWLGVTGALTVAFDIHSVLADVPASNPNLIAMRRDMFGPENYKVINSGDYDLETLPADLSLEGMLSNVMKGARASVGDRSLTFVELRMADGAPVGQVGFGRNDELRFDASSGAALGKPPPAPNDQKILTPSPRNVIKRLHRMTFLTDRVLWMLMTVAVALMALMVTGLVFYFRLWRARQRIGRANPFWTTGGWWRWLHRSVSIVSALFLTFMAVTGVWLSIDSLSYGYYGQSHRVVSPSGGALRARDRDVSSPLVDDALGGMLKMTLTAYQSAVPGVPPRVVRLRYYGGMSQGVVISGEHIARQLVFDTATGRQVSMTEPGYPPTGYTFGWNAQQMMKSAHRGDYFGVTGQFMTLFSGLAMAYLSVSGIVMYWNMWRRRRAQGRAGLFWA
jgi:uncharacterized iron-regulated membrane protein